MHLAGVDCDAVWLAPSLHKDPGDVEGELTLQQTDYAVAFLLADADALD